MVKPFFLDCREKWLFGTEMDKMVTTGGFIIHLKKAPELSKE